MRDKLTSDRATWLREEMWGALWDLERIDLNKELRKGYHAGDRVRDAIHLQVWHKVAVLSTAFYRGEQGVVTIE